MKKLLGYRLKKEKYREAAKEICHSDLDGSFLVKGCDIASQDSINRAEQAGVMHWFEEVYEENPKYKKGVWYIDHKGSIVCSTKDQDELRSGYGISFFSGSWYDNDVWYLSDLRPATDKEVEEALIKEAKKRGFKEGVKFLEPERHGNKKAEGCVSSHFKYNHYEDGEQVLLTFGRAVFCDGQWAEILPENKTEIVTFEDGRKAKITWI